MEDNTSFLNDFCRIEKEKDLYNRRYAGFPYWQYLRMGISERIQVPEYVAGREINRRKERSFLNIFKFVFCSLLAGVRSLIYVNHIKECDVLEFEHNSLPGTKALFYDFWEMPQGIVVERLNESASPLTKSSKTLQWLYLKNNMSFVFHRLFHKYPVDKEEDEFLRELILCLNNRFGSNLSMEYVHRVIRYNYYAYRIGYKYFLKLFKKTKCKAITVVCYYQWQFYPAYHAAHDMNIKIIEFQHGLISNHLGYWFDKELNTKRSLPDYILLFGEYWKRCSKISKETEAVVTGYPYQNYQIYEQANIETHENVIIIYPSLESEYELFLSEIIDKVTDIGYKVFVKLHPNQSDYESFYPILSKNKNAVMVNDKSKGIYYWLKYGKYHIVKDSTVGFEAASVIGAKILIPLNYNHFNLQDLLDHNYAEGFYTIEDLVEILRNNSKVEAIRTNDYYAPQAAINMSYFFKELLND